MTAFLLIMGILLPIFVVILLGLFYGRWAKPNFMPVNQLNLTVCTPLLIFCSFSAKDFDFSNFFILLPASLLVMLGSGILAWPCIKALKGNARAILPTAMFNNAGYLGIPVGMMAFGSAGVGGFVLMFALSSILHVSLGASIFGGQWQSRNLLKSPVTIASFLGLGLGLLDWHLPDGLFAGLKMLGDVSVPLMLFSLGIRMSSVKWAVLHQGLFGAILAPVTGLVMAYFAIRLLNLSPEMAAILWVYASLPPAILNFLLAELYDQDPEQVATVVLLGHVLSLGFIPLGLYLGLYLGL